LVDAKLDKIERAIGPAAATAASAAMAAATATTTSVPTAPATTTTAPAAATAPPTTTTVPTTTTAPPTTTAVPKKTTTRPYHVPGEGDCVHHRRLGVTRDLPRQWQKYYHEEDGKAAADKALKYRVEHDCDFSVTKHKPTITGNVYVDPRTCVKKGDRGIKQAARTAHPKIVVGIPTATRYCRERMAHRATWMREPHVCGASRHGEDGCHIFPFFLYAKVERSSIEDYDDQIILEDVPHAKKQNEGYDPAHLKNGRWSKEPGKTKDMWREGNLKTPAWLRYAYKHFEWATHVVKMDMDTYPLWYLIYDDFKRAPAARVFYGRPFNGGFRGRGGNYGELYAFTRDMLGCAVLQVDNRTECGQGQNRYSFEGSAEDQVVGTILVCSVKRVPQDCPEFWWYKAPPRRWHHQR